MFRLSFTGHARKRLTTDLKLSDGGGLTRWLHDGGKAEAGSRRDVRSRSLQRMVSIPPALRAGQWEKKLGFVRVLCA
jgi:hypothetical protein